MTVIAIDPGGTTGIAIRIGEDKYITCTASKPEEVYDIIKNAKPTHVIVENFQAQMIGKYGLLTVRIVGGCYCAAYFVGAEYVSHIPQDRYAFQKEAKAYLTRKRMEEGISFVIHEEDALAHLLRWEHDVR